MEIVQPPKQTSKPIPELPEYAKLWRDVLARREALVREIEDWERPDHPIARELAKVVELYGSHGRTDRTLAEGERNAAANAEKYREKLQKLDAELARGGRDSGDERALSVRQLRELIDAVRHELAPRAREAVAEWLEHPDDLYLRRRAHELLSRVAAPGVWVDPEELARDERANRAGRSGKLDRLASRIVSRVMGPT